jgi:hypothetical protein
MVANPSFGEPLERCIEYGSRDCESTKRHQLIRKAPDREGRGFKVQHNKELSLELQ